MWTSVDERRFAMTLTNNPTCRAFASQPLLTLNMANLNGQEQYAELLQAPPVSARGAGTVRNGDLMLYGATTLARRTRWPACGAHQIFQEIIYFFN